MVRALFVVFVPWIILPTCAPNFKWRTRKLMLWDSKGKAIKATDKAMETNKGLGKIEGQTTKGEEILSRPTIIPELETTLTSDGEMMESPNNSPTLKPLKAKTSKANQVENPFNLPIPKFKTTKAKPTTNIHTKAKVNSEHHSNTKVDDLLILKGAIAIGMIMVKELTTRGKKMLG